MRLSYLDPTLQRGIALLQALRARRRKNLTPTEQYGLRER